MLNLSNRLKDPGYNHFKYRTLSITTVGLFERLLDQSRMIKEPDDRNF